MEQSPGQAPVLELIVHLEPDLTLKLAPNPLVMPAPMLALFLGMALVLALVLALTRAQTLAPPPPSADNRRDPEEAPAGRSAG
jgi:hypothetical protein